MLVHTPVDASRITGRTAAVELCVLGESVFSGVGTAVRCEKRARGDRVGVKLLGTADLDAVRRRAREARFKASLQAGLGVYQGVPADYRAAISEAAVTLQHWRAITCKREGEIREEESLDQVERLCALEELVELRLRTDWNRARHDAIAASNQIDPSNRAGILAAKRMTELILTPILSEGLIWAHAYQKPRGYPGDFELMNLMYENRRRGSSVFSRVVHQIGLEERLAATVRTRRDYLTAEILAEASRRCTGASEFRVANLGSGPAQELVAVVREWTHEARLVLTLVDQDQEALEYADRVLRVGGASLGDRLEIRCRHVAFQDLMGDRRLLLEIAGQDLIYSAGFFDYLPDRVASELIADLTSLVRPGGKLLVGNALDSPDVKWVPEFVLDWSLICRGPQDMSDLCRSCELADPPTVVHDASGAWQFLELRR